ncbi:signal transduction histidine kinase [Mycoplasma sp. CAG:472]|nr:signal transduction histidine kinase [Mycoplasma sp. CAG:472]
MKNKKTIILIIVIILIYVFSFNMVYLYQENIYKEKYNKFVNNIISVIKEKYPDISNKNIIDILNNKTNLNYLNEYGIDYNNEFALISMHKENKKIFIINNVILGSFILVLSIILIINKNYENNKLEEIIHLIEEINKKNYNLNIQGTDETMISKLKNEMYKTVVMLKNDADNSLKDKIIIKTYLEDISHQLKTPLTVINISLDNLIDNPNMDEKNRNEFISKISKEVTNINNLIQNLLKLSKFDVNVINFINKSVSIKEFINKSIDKISLIADLKNINIKVNILNDFNLNIDLNWQIEALSNIVKNAIEHSNENDIVYINCNDNKIYSKIEIINNGIINDKDLNKIFDRFYTNKKGYSESVGIGLSLAKNIIEKNNGKIDVYSKDGKTIFTIKYYK